MELLRASLVIVFLLDIVITAHKSLHFRSLGSIRCYRVHTDPAYLPPDTSARTPEPLNIQHHVTSNTLTWQQTFKEHIWTLQTSTVIDTTLQASRVGRNLQISALPLSRYHGTTRNNLFVRLGPRRTANWPILTDIYGDPPRTVKPPPLPTTNLNLLSNRMKPRHIHHR